MPENGSGNDIDHLQISIEANAAKAASGIDRLAEALKKLGQNSGAINKSFFSDLATGLKPLADLNLKSVGTTLNAVAKLPKAFEGLEKIDISAFSEQITKLAEALSPLAEKMSGVAPALAALSHLFTTGKGKSAGIKETTFDYSRLGRVLSALAKPFNKAAAAAGSFLKKLGSRVIHAFTGRIERLATGVHRLFNSIRRVVLMRAIRAVLREITAGFKEGIDNLYQWSALVDGRFKASMDKIATSMLYLKNSLAAMVSPIINKLAPAIDWLVDRFVDLLNIVNQVFSALTGSDTWTKAIKYPVEYAEGMADAAKSTKEAAKELKLFLLPFDELNVLTKDNPADTSTPGGAGQGGLNYAEMFETRELEDWAKKIKDLIDQGDWYGAGAALAEHLNGIIEQWDSYAWGEILAEKLNNAISFALGFMRTFEWDTLGERVSQFLRGIIETLNWEDLGALLASKWNALFGFLGGFFRDFSGTDLGVDLSVAFNAWVEEINWDMIGETVNEGVNDVLDGIIAFLKRADTEELGAGIQTMMDKIEWDDIMAKAWEAIKLAIEKTWNLGGDIIEAVWNNGDTGKLTVVVSAFAALAAVVGKVLGVVAKAWPVISKIIELFGGGSGALAGTGATLAAGLPGAAAVGASLGGLGVFGASEANAITKGVNWKNALGNIAGGTLAGAGIGGIIGLAGGPIGAGIGAAAGSQVGLIATAWTKAIQEIIENWDQIKEKASEVFDWISEKWGLVTEWISEKWTLVSDWFSEKWTAISTWVDENVIQPVKAVIDPIVEWIKTLLEGIRIIFDAFLKFSATLVDTLFVQPAIRHWNNFVENVNKLIEWFKTTKFYKFIENLVAAFKKGVENLKTAWRVGWEAISKIVSVVWTSIKAGFAAAWAYIKSSFITPLWNAMSSLGKAIVSAFKTAFYTVEWIGASVVNALLAKVEGAINAIIDGLNFFVGIFNRIVEAAAMYTGASWSGLGEIGHVSLGRIDTSSISNNMANSAMDTGYYAADALSNIGGGVGDMFGDMADAIRGSGRERSQQIDVTVELDGEKVGRSVVNYVNEQTWANGQSPMLAY